LFAPSFGSASRGGEFEPVTAYLDALKMLARRELSEAQVRQRLGRRGHATDEIDAAIEKLRAERALDDERVAETIARTQSHVRGRGRFRVRQEIEAAGIGRAVADRAVNEAFKEVDSSALLEAAIARRLRGRTGPVDDREFRRLFRYLVGQGFESDRVLRALKARLGRAPDSSD
jgi:regulatory protein